MEAKILKTSTKEPVAEYYNNAIIETFTTTTRINSYGDEISCDTIKIHVNGRGIDIKINGYRDDLQPLYEIVSKYLKNKYIHK